mgnify:CR=1 FL=1
MASPHPSLIVALRETAKRLRTGSTYRWSNYGMCNCGHLAQTVTRLSPREIHLAAMERPGDWGEQAREYCSTTGLEMDHIIEQLLALGLTRQDIHDLERLSNLDVLRRLDPTWQKVRHHSREYVVRYLDAWADMLEEQQPAPDRMAAK